MCERRKVLELFEQQKAYTEKRVQEGIETYRKTDAVITLKDRKGNPVKNATVTVKQKSHAFKYGANLFMLDELETKEKNDLYKKHMRSFGNMATLPFYWDATEPEQGKTRYDKDSEKLYRRPPIDLCVEFCQANGIEPREHALAYENFFPKWLYDASVEEIKTALEKRYAEISQRYADKIPTIEVTNEMEWAKGKTAFYDEADYVLWCFRLAEKYFPNNQLVINEHTSSCWADRCRATDKYYAYIEANMLKGARIDAIGMQYHMFNKAEDEYKNTRYTYDPINLYKHMDLYSNFGKPLQVTEVTIPAYSNAPEDEALQAEIIENLYSIWFSHPNMEQIIYWNLPDGYAHAAKPGDMTKGENYYYGGLFRFDMTPKPAYYTIKNLFEKKWHTEAEITSDSDGMASFKGFYGKYDVDLEIDGKKTVKEINLSKKSEKKFEIVI